MCISCLSTFFFRYYRFYRSPKMREPTWVAGFSKPFIKPSQTQQLPLPLAPPRFPIRGSSDNPIPGQRSRVEGPGCFCGALRMADLFETNQRTSASFSKLRQQSLMVFYHVLPPCLQWWLKCIEISYLQPGDCWKLIELLFSSTWGLKTTTNSVA